MNNWKEKLEIWTKNKEVNESLSTEIVVEFMKEEIYPLLTDLKEKFSEQQTSCEIYPCSPDNITTETSVCISIQKQNGYKYSLKFEKNKEQKNEVIIKIKSNTSRNTESEAPWPVTAILTPEGKDSLVKKFKPYIDEFYETNK